MAKNYLYIASNADGLVKIGITDKEPEKRVNSFGRKYPKKFEFIMSFEISNFENQDIETIMHQFFNTQLLNTAFLYKTCNIIEFKDYVENSPNGYTEIFLSKPIFLANCLTFLHMIGALELNSSHIEKIKEKIKEYPISELSIKYKQEFNEIRKKQNIELPILKPIFNARNKIHQINFNKFLSLGESVLDFTLTQNKNDFYLSTSKNKTNLVNFLHGNESYNTLCKIITTNSKNEININEIINLFKFNNKNITTQKNNTVNRRDKNKKIANELAKSKKLQEILLNEIEYILEEYRPHKVEPFMQIKEDIISGELYSKLNFNVLNSDNLFSEYDVTSQNRIKGLKRLSVLIYEFKENLELFHPFFNVKKLEDFRKLTLYIINYINNPLKYGSSEINVTEQHQHRDNIRNFTYQVFEYPEVYRYASALFKQKINNQITLEDYLFYYSVSCSESLAYCVSHMLFNSNKYKQLQSISSAREYIDEKIQIFTDKVGRFIKNNHAEYKYIIKLNDPTKQKEIINFVYKFYEEVDRFKYLDHCNAMKVFDFMEKVATNNNYLIKKKAKI